MTELCRKVLFFFFVIEGKSDIIQQKMVNRQLNGIRGGRGLTGFTLSRRKGVSDELEIKCRIAGFTTEMYNDFFKFQTTDGNILRKQFEHIDPGINITAADKRVVPLIQHQYIFQANPIGKPVIYFANR